ncbi:hypothetical protein [Streptomyces sp. UG1]
MLEDELFIADSGRTLRSMEPQTGKEIWRSEELADGRKPHALPG